MAVEVAQSRPMMSHLLGHGLRGGGGVLGAGAPGEEVLAHLGLDAAHVALEGLAVQAARAGGHALVEEDVGLGALHLLRPHEVHLQVVVLVPLLRPALVLAVGDVVPATHGAYVLDQTDQPVLSWLLWRLVQETRQVQGLVNRKCHDPRVLGPIEPAGIVPESLDVDAQNLRKVLEGNPLFAIILLLAVLTIVLVLAAQELRRAVLSQAICHLHSLVVEPALHLPWDAS
mmetsp:Transcript_125474/g.366512  ORF Transcript_125474/g.366512 Transcript_125474/m.366512 type:complete len:229 (-) Transcript_125474:356-1042(-)